MKAKKILFAVLFSIALSTTLESHAQSWVRTGNNILPTDYFGTNNIQPIIFKTGSGAGPMERMRILPNNGFIGIGNTLPLFPVDMLNTNYARTLNIHHSVATANPNVALNCASENTGGGSTDGVFSDIINTAESGGVFIRAFHASVAGSGSGVHYGMYSTISGTGGGGQYGSYSKIDNVGDGNHYGYYASLTGIGSGLRYGVYSSVTGGSGTRYGVYSDASGGSNWSFYGLGRGYFSESVGIRIIPEITGLHIQHGVGYTYNGLRIENSGANNHEWTLYTQNEEDFLDFRRGGTLEVRFTDDGTIDEVSDGRLKKDVEDLYSILDKINLLKPKTFRFIHKPADSRKSIGFIAQDLEKVFPEFVHYGGDGEKVYSVNYSGLSVIALKAIQEQQEQIVKQQAQINEQKVQIEELKAQYFSQPLNTDGIARFKLDQQSREEPLLGQNIPNPFDQSTVIPFRVPKDCKDASIVITETSTGKIVKAISVSCGETQLSIDSGLLLAGNYTYSLHVDGQRIDTKQMVITK